MLKGKKGKRTSLTFRSVIIHCLFLAFSCLYVNAYSTGSVTHSKAEFRGSSAYSSQTFLSTSQSPFRGHFSLAQKTIVLEAPEDNEVDESIPDGHFPLIGNYSCASIYNTSSIRESNFPRTRQFINSHATVSLVILYHSWKSFLL
jgi:hypothetical protein